MKYFLKVFFLVIICSTLYSSCSKEVIDQELIPQFDSVADAENHYYRTVKIGSQWWMAENLQVTVFNDGTPIRNAVSNDLWLQNIAGYAKYQNNVNAPGLLYNGYALNDIRGIAPTGWHVATEEDWQRLELFIGIASSEIYKEGWRGTKEAMKLKIAGKSAWVTNVETWATNSTGFSATAGSCRLQSGIWGNPGLFYTAFYWTNTDAGSNKYFYRHLDYRENKILRGRDNMNCGYSVRCVKNN